MKKSLGIAVVAVFLFSPIFAMAGIIGYADIKVYWSPPIESGYYLDYDGDMTMVGEEKSSLVEMFCVENQDASHDSERYTLYSIDDSLRDLLDLDPDTYKLAAWIADNYADRYAGSDFFADLWKGEVQKAIWDPAVTNVMNIVEDHGIDSWILNSLPTVLELEAYDARGWMLAKNGTYQDYLVPNGAPVPEPATMLLLGTGLIGLAGLGRKRFKKSA